MTIISYGALLTESSKRNKGERRLRSISPKLRLAALESTKLRYPAHSEMTSVIAALDAKALMLAAGTIFTAGNMVRSPDSLSASKLGRLWRAHIEQGSAVRFNPSMFGYSAKIAAFGDNYLLPNENSEQIRSFWIVKNNHMYTYIYWK